ncbi:hypothetical protein NE237_026785 [Protea cynaroides]|uniref:NAD(P)H dehydrogenase (quinone) n=1 Tax=Protea cynaroides TaxID=273540 RepID=A0A9Q0JTS7_9MAGN|nr:hypothetical protein NE237_026785 [Protea cynaroides]
MKAPPKANNVTMINHEQLVEADDFLFGFPSRFEMMAALCQAFFDSSHELGDSHTLASKPAGIIWSISFHGGGQKNTVGANIKLENYIIQAAATPLILNSLSPTTDTFVDHNRFVISCLKYVHL